jgi:hypothetical protein
VADSERLGLVGKHTQNNDKVTSVFTEMVVIASLYDAKNSPPEKLEKLKKHITKKSNSIAKSPNGTILASIFDGKSEELKIVYPFFSSHFSLPISVGETIWCISADGNFFYLSRKHAINIDNEDPNFTVPARTPPNVKEDQKIKTSDKMEGTSPAPPVSSHTNPNPVKDTSPEFGKLLVKQNTIGATEFYGEPVPRFPVDPDDFAIQGSNNTLIVLGKESSKKAAGTINIVAGRGTSEETAPKVIVTNGSGYEEVDKSTPDQNLSEGAQDYINDSSRILVSMNSNIDDKFGIEIINLDDINTKATAMPAIVSKSTNQLIIGREEGTVRIVHESGSSIVMDEKGNIQIQCGPSGKIRIGQKDASKEPAVLGATLVSMLKEILTQIQAISVPTGVGPSGPPVNSPAFSTISAKLAEIQSGIINVE